MLPFTIGLTGGLGSGKTTVCKIFKKQGVPVIDADCIAREVVSRPCIRTKIIRILGTRILDRRGHLDRNAIRRLMLTSPRKRRCLEKTLHPAIWKTIHQKIQAVRAPYCIVAVPLLLETGQDNLFARTLVIDTPEIYRIRRVKRRNAWPLTEILAMLSLQVSRATRLLLADDIILNNGGLKHLTMQVRTLHKKYALQTR